MSATGHAITLFKPMEIREINRSEYTLDGTPADCVKIALYHLFPKISFDMVISGINHGPNMGEDIFYSGTVAGAREAVMNKVFAIAASVDCWTEQIRFDFASDFIVEMLDKIDNSILSEAILLNVNFPNNPKPKGVQITDLGKRVYKDFIQVSFEEKEGRKYVTIAGDDPSFKDCEGSDLNKVHEGYVSITPLANEVFESGVREKIRCLENEKWACLA
jgi:5'-nucleotidase